MLPSVTVYGVRGQSRYEVVVRVGSILFGKNSAHPWCTGTIFGYSITQVSNRIFTIKCRQSGRSGGEGQGRPLGDREKRPSR